MIYGSRLASSFSRQLGPLDSRPPPLIRAERGTAERIATTRPRSPPTLRRQNPRCRWTGRSRGRPNQVNRCPSAWAGPRTGQGQGWCYLPARAARAKLWEGPINRAKWGPVARTPPSSGSELLRTPVAFVGPHGPFALTLQPSLTLASIPCWPHYLSVSSGHLRWAPHSLHFHPSHCCQFGFGGPRP